MENTTTSNALGAVNVTITYPARDAALKEFRELLARMEWRRDGDPDFDWKYDECFYCNGFKSLPVSVRTGEPYDLAPSQHDTWCPFIRLRELIQQQGGVGDL